MKDPIVIVSNGNIVNRNLWVIFYNQMITNQMTTNQMITSTTILDLNSYIDIVKYKVDLYK